MMELRGFGDGAMNLLELILLAALSAGIVAVSLRLRPSTYSEGVWRDGDRFEGDHRTTRKAERRGRQKNPFSVRGEAGSTVR